MHRGHPISTGNGVPAGWDYDCSHSSFTDQRPALPIIPNIRKTQDQPRHTISSSTFIPAPHASLQSSVKQTGQVFWLSASYFCTHSLTPSGFNELYVLMPVGGEHGVLLLRRNKPLKLFDPALAIVTGDRAGHSRSEWGRLVLQSRATILGRSNGFSVKGHSALGMLGMAPLGYCFSCLVLSTHTHTHRLCSHCTQIQFGFQIWSSEVLTDPFVHLVLGISVILLLWLL